MTIEKLRQPLFHSLTVLVVSLVGAAIYAVWITRRFRGENLSGQYIYVVPIIVPFIAFIFDRLELAALAIDRRIRRASSEPPARSFYHPIQICIDALVVGTALLRVVSSVPLVSGHTLFLSYAMLSSRSRVARITAALILVETIYLKYFVWHQ